MHQSWRSYFDFALFMLFRTEKHAAAYECRRDPLPAGVGGGAGPFDEVYCCML